MVLGECDIQFESAGGGEEAPVQPNGRTQKSRGKK